MQCSLGSACIFFFYRNPRFSYDLPTRTQSIVCFSERSSWKFWEVRLFFHVEKFNTVSILLWAFRNDSLARNKIFAHADITQETKFQAYSVDQKSLFHKSMQLHTKRILNQPTFRFHGSPTAARKRLQIPQCNRSVFMHRIFLIWELQIVAAEVLARANFMPCFS